MLRRFFVFLRHMNSSLLLSPLFSQLHLLSLLFSPSASVGSSVLHSHAGRRVLATLHGAPWHRHIELVVARKGGFERARRSRSRRKSVHHWVHSQILGALARQRRPIRAPPVMTSSHASVFFWSRSTRFETRTKESNSWASFLVGAKPASALKAPLPSSLSLSPSLCLPVSLTTQLSLQVTMCSTRNSINTNLCSTNLARPCFYSQVSCPPDHFFFTVTSEAMTWVAISQIC